MSANGSKKPNQGRRGKNERYGKYDKRKQVEDKLKDQNNCSLSSRDRDNDPNWYFLDKAIADQASSFSFGEFLGRVAPTGKYAGSQISEMWVPTIMAIHVNPCPGDTNSLTTGINMAALKTYTTLSSMNAKTTNYAPQDLTMLLLSLGEIISVMEHIRRAFGVAFTYNQRNRALPRNLIERMGFDADDFLDHLAPYRLEFNSWVTAINKIPFLDNIAYLYKCARMYDSVYTDSDSAMAQIVFMRPYSTWRLNETKVDTGSILETVYLPIIGQTWDKWRQIVTSMIQALFESATFNYIYSDVLNYSQKVGAKLLFMDYLNEGYVVVPTYNRNFMLQVHNLTPIGSPASVPIPGTNRTVGNDVYTDTNKNKIKYTPIFSSVGYDTTIIDFDTPTASVEDRIEATRYQCVLNKTVITHENVTYYEASGLPDHYVTHVSFDVAEDEGSVPDYDSYVNVVKDETLGDEMERILGLTQFDWAPIIQYHNGKIHQYETYILGDLNYFTTLDVDWFKRVNDIVFQSLFTLREKESR